MKVIVLNGFPRSGKDEFVNIAKTVYNCINHSTVGKVKEIATIMGWDGDKTPKNRQMLSKLKDLYTEYFDGPFIDIIHLICMEMAKEKPCDIIFIHVREPKEIQRIKRFCTYKDNISFCSILVKRPESEKDHTSHSDKNVNNFVYDITINNDSTLEIYKRNVLSVLSELRVFDKYL